MRTNVLAMVVALLDASLGMIGAEQQTAPAPVGHLVARDTEWATTRQGALRRARLDEVVFKASIDFEPTSTLVIPGQDFAVDVYLKNLGPSVLELTEMWITLRLNAVGSPEKLPPLERRVEPGQRILIGVIKGSWSPDIKTWVAVVDVASGPEHCIRRIAFSRREVEPRR